jgi:hypothetical protein
MVISFSRYTVYTEQIGATQSHRAENSCDTAGIEFIDENGGGAGVRLRKPAAKK